MTVVEERAVIIGDVEWRHRLLVPVLISIGMIVAVVSSLGSPMVPTVAAEYGISFGTAQWMLTIVLLVGAAVTPLIGKLGDGPSRRQVIIGSLGLIAFGGLLAAIPGSFPLLLLGRAFQGVGLGLMPVAMAVARDHLPAERAPSTVAALSITTAAGVGIGYPVSGLAAQFFGLHATYLLAAALAAIAMVGAVLTVPPSSHRARQSIDFVGAGLLALGLTAMVIALSEISAWGVTSTAFLATMALAAGMLGGWVLHQQRTAHPLINLRSLANPSVRIAQVAAVLSGVGMYFLMSQVVRYVQTPTSTGYGQGGSVFVAGLVLVPFSLASLAVSRLLPLLRRWPGPQWLMALGSVAFMVAVAVFATSRTDLWQLLLVMALAGIGAGTVFAMIPMMIVSGVPAHETGSALGFNAVLRTVGGSVGSAVSAAVLTAHTVSGSRYPQDEGYTVSALISLTMWIAIMFVGWPRKSLQISALDDARLQELESESIDGEAAGVVIYEMDPEPVEHDDVTRSALHMSAQRGASR